MVACPQGQPGYEDSSCSSTPEPGGSCRARPLSHPRTAGHAPGGERQREPSARSRVGQSMAGGYRATEVGSSGGVQGGRRCKPPNQHTCSQTRAHISTYRLAELVGFCLCLLFIPLTRVALLLKVLPAHTEIIL